MSKCFECAFKGPLKEEKCEHLLDDVAIVEAVTLTCPKCGAANVAFDRMEEMYRLVALELADKPTRLLPKELKWLRKYLGYESGSDWAEYLGVSRETVSGWENHGRVPEATEKLLRMMVKVGGHIDEYGAPKTFDDDPAPSPPRFNRNTAGRWVRV